MSSVDQVYERRATDGAGHEELHINVYAAITNHYRYNVSLAADIITRTAGVCESYIGSFFITWATKYGSRRPMATAVVQATRRDL